MKKTKVFASVVALAMTVMTVFSTGSVVKAAEVTDSPRIKLDIETEDEEKKIDEEYYNALVEYLGWKAGTNSVSVQKGDTVSFSFDLEGTGYSKADIETLTFMRVPPCYRDANGKLQFLSNIGLGMNEISMCECVNTEDPYQQFPDHEIYLEQKNTYVLDDTELYIIRVRFADNSGLDNLVISANYKEYEGDIMQSKWYGEIYTEVSSYWLEDKKETTATTQFSNVHLAKSDDKPVEDTTDNEDYTLDLSTSTAPVSAESFAALLTENETKDVVIKSNNNVTFTFAKGTMKAVEGKEAYDFSTTINNAYSEELPFYITQTNFVSQIHFNYSGKLPAEASIRFSVGTQYAGKTLYYSLMNEDKTFAEVQAVTVDAEGYMTVKQNHCSTYVVTTEEPKIQTDTEMATSPKTGDNMPVLPLLGLCVSGIGMMMITKMKKKAK